MKSRFIFLVLLAVSALFAVAAPASASKNLYFATGDDGSNAEVMAFSLSADGTPAPLQTFEGTSGGYFNAISMSPDGKHVFIADYSSNEIRSLLVGADGKLTDAPGSPMNVPGTGPYGSAVTPDGRFVIFGMYDGHGVQAFAIGANGALSAAPGGLVELDPAARPFGIAISTDSRTLYVPVDATDSLYSLRIGTDGLLAELPGSPIPTGVDVSHVGVTPDGRFLYAPDESTAGVYAYSLGGDGTPAALSGSPYPVMDDIYGGFAVSPDGRMLYSSGNSDEIQSASIAPDGALTVGPSITIGKYNPGLALNPSGNRLYNGVDGGASGNPLLTYSVGTTGALTPFGDPLPLPDPIGPDSDSMVVSPAQPPVAVLTTTSGSNRDVSLDASGSTDPDSPIATYAWDFGDGQTASTTTSTTSHTYAADGSYPVTVTLTDADGCSTKEVFAGRTAYCNGSGIARAAATASATTVVPPDRKVTGAKVTARKTQKQKGRKLVIKVKAGAKEAVRLQATGSARFKRLKGKVALRKVKGQAAAGKTTTLRLGAKSKKKGRAAAGRKGKATISVKFTDRAGNSATRKITVRLK